MNKAIFLDRDGVINIERGEYTYKKEDFHLINGLEDVLIQYRNKGYLFIVITNQSGISKNIYTHNDVRLLHEIMKEKLQKHSIIIEDVYYCPHHNETGKCLCRKPGSLLFEKAIVRFNIDVNKSLMFGDKERDIIAAESVGIKSILVKPNQLLPLINME